METVITKQAGSKIYHWPKQGDWTYNDYLRLPEDEWRYEMVDPGACTADVYALRGQAYVPFGHFTSDSTAQSELLPDLHIPMPEICS
jgi:hypothetical protein